MKVQSKVKQKIRNGELSLGSWIMMGDLAAAEIMAQAGFDWITVDMEHTDIDYRQLQILLAGIRPYGPEVFVRVEDNNPVAIKHVLDCGAGGIIVPLVTSRKEAEKAVKAAKYPPEGIRGISLGRASDYGNNFDDYFKSDKSWITGQYLEINDSIVLNNNFKELLKANKDYETIVISPKVIKANFNKIIQKRELGKIYQLLKEIHEFKLDILLRRIEYNQIILKYAVEIFVELDLIEKNDEYYIVKDDVIRTELQKSPTFLELVEKKKIIDLIYYDYNSHIKSYLKERMEG